MRRAEPERETSLSDVLPCKAARDFCSNCEAWVLEDAVCWATASCGIDRMARTREVKRVARMGTSGLWIPRDRSGNETWLLLGLPGPIASTTAKISSCQDKSSAIPPMCMYYLIRAPKRDFIACCI